MPLPTSVLLAVAAYLGAFAAVAPVVAGEVRAADDPAALSFVHKVVAAINRNDIQARRALMHPDAVKCDVALKQAMAEGAFVPKQGPIPAGYRWEMRPMPAGATGWFSDRFDYPVRPTHQLHIDFDAGPSRSAAIVLQVVRYRSEWREVTGCPKPQTIVEARRAAKARAEQDMRIRRLAAEIAPDLKAEVLRRAAAGNKVDAILHYRKATNEGLAVAKGVVERLIQEAGEHAPKR